MKRTLLFFAAVVVASVAFSQEQPDPCSDRLRRLHPILRDYAKESGRMPTDLYDLYREAFVQDPKELFCPDGFVIAGSGDRLDRATPYQILSAKFEGELLCCDEARRDKMRVLLADGRVELRSPDLDRLYGRWTRPTDSSPFPEEALDRPSARLGLLLRESPTNGSRLSVWVGAIVPGFNSSVSMGGMADFRPGDRLLTVSGRRVTTLRELEAFMKEASMDRHFIEVLRGRKVMGRYSLVPVELFPSGTTPRAIARHAEVAVSDEGSGDLGAFCDVKGGRVTITVVDRNSAADKCGLRVGDTLLSLENHPATTVEGWYLLVRSFKVGSVVRIRYRREGREGQAEAKLEPARTLDRDNLKFRIFAGQLRVDEALRYANFTISTAVVSLLEQTRGLAAARVWLDQAIANPSPLQSSPIALQFMREERERLVKRMAESTAVE